MATNSSNSNSNSNLKLAISALSKKPGEETPEETKVIDEWVEATFDPDEDDTPIPTFKPEGFVFKGQKVADIGNILTEPQKQKEKGDIIKFLKAIDALLKHSEGDTEHGTAKGYNKYRNPVDICVFLGNEMGEKSCKGGGDAEKLIKYITTMSNAIVYYFKYCVPKKLKDEMMKDEGTMIQFHKTIENLIFFYALKSMSVKPYTGVLSKLIDGLNKAFGTEIIRRRCENDEEKYTCGRIVARTYKPCETSKNFFLIIGNTQGTASMEASVEIYKNIDELPKACGGRRKTRKQKKSKKSTRKDKRSKY